MALLPVATPLTKGESQNLPQNTYAWLTHRLGFLSGGFDTITIRDYYLLSDDFLFGQRLNTTSPLTYTLEDALNVGTWTSWVG